MACQWFPLVGLSPLSSNTHPIISASRLRYNTQKPGDVPLSIHLQMSFAYKKTLEETEKHRLTVSLVKKIQKDNLSYPPCFIFSLIRFFLPLSLQPQDLRGRSDFPFQETPSLAPFLTFKLSPNLCSSVSPSLFQKALGTFKKNIV